MLWPAPVAAYRPDETDRALFFLEWYDGLMNFTGTDHVDHWMKTVNWSPALTRAQGRNRRDAASASSDQTVGRATSRGARWSSSTAPPPSPTATATAVASLMVGAA